MRLLTFCVLVQVTIRDLDPKSISTQELYGYVNMATREWKDGLLSYNMRELANQPDDNPKWILLDGDLDANWWGSHAASIYCKQSHQFLSCAA